MALTAEQEAKLAALADAMDGLADIQQLPLVDVGQNAEAFIAEAKNVETGESYQISLGKFFTKRFLNRYNGEVAADLNDVLSGGGCAWNYHSRDTWSNAPKDMGYGSIFQLNSSETDDLALQIAVDVNHDSDTLATGDMWFRAHNNLVWGSWKRLIADDEDNSTPWQYISSGGLGAYYKKDKTGAVVLIIAIDGGLVGVDLSLDLPTEFRTGIPTGQGILPIVAAAVGVNPARLYNISFNGATLRFVGDSDPSYTAIARLSFYPTA